MWRLNGVKRLMSSQLKLKEFLFDKICYKVRTNCFMGFNYRYNYQEPAYQRTTKCSKYIKTFLAV